MRDTIRLLDLLACPDCRGRLQRNGQALRCAACGESHPIESDGLPHEIPRLLPRGERDLEIEHDRDLVVRPEYVTCLDRMIEALASDQLVLDIGAGERETADPRVIRLDLRFTPRVEVVADAHVLPFQDSAFDVVLAGAVFEHLADPFAAAREIYRVLKPGGMVVADCAWVFPYHGFPASYFNASGDGMRQVFRDFREVRVEVPPWFMPSFGLETVLSEWVRLCRPNTENDRAFLDAVRHLATFDVRALDKCFTQEDALRIAAGVAFLGVKQPAGDESVLPPAAMQMWREDPGLQARYPRPEALLTTLWQDEPDTFVRWSATSGRARSAELSAWYDARPRVAKTLHPSG